MKIAVVHYHLQPGGVTRVIENTLESFSLTEDSPEFVVLSGRQYPGNAIKNVRVVDGLDYSSSTDSVSPMLLKEKMEEAAREGLGGKPDIWHIHNHSLGKNPALTKAVDLLAQESSPMLLHPHDFAEDGRPANFDVLKEIYSTTYPSSPFIHYAVLNHRDQSFLKKLFGAKASTVHLLANAISVPQEIARDIQPSTKLPENLFLYPVRAVRRKNLGELALIAASHPGKHFANSLGPTNPNFAPVFEKWKSFCRELELPVTFGLGESIQSSFPEMVDHARGIISTSIAEGFGLGFLEPWTFGKFLYGRNIPEITEDFSNLGINLDQLYGRLNVDLSHFSSVVTLKEKISLVIRRYFTDYAQNIPENATEIAYRSMVRDNQVDFGRLDESFQEEIINSVSQSKSAQEEIRKQVKIENPDSGIIEKNKDSISRNYAQRTYVERLGKIYHSILNAPRDQLEYAQGEDLLHCFLSPERFNLLRT